DAYPARDGGPWRPHHSPRAPPEVPSRRQHASAVAARARQARTPPSPDTGSGHVSAPHRSPARNDRNPQAPRNRHDSRRGSRRGSRHSRRKRLPQQAPSRSRLSPFVARSSDPSPKPLSMILDLTHYGTSRPSISCPRKQSLPRIDTSHRTARSEERRVGKECHSREER